jgi:hypothetical protein
MMPIHAVGLAFFLITTTAGAVIASVGWVLDARQARHTK